MSDEEKKKKRLDLVDVKMMLTLAGAGCIVVLFFLFIGKFNSVLTIVSKLFSAMTPIIIGIVKCAGGFVEHDHFRICYSISS